MTVQERFDCIRFHPDWQKTRAGRYAAAVKTGRIGRESTFIGDVLTVIDGRVCIPVCPAAGMKFRDAFKFSGAWYIPERAARYIREEHGRAVYAAAVDMARAKRLATV